MINEKRIEAAAQGYSDATYGTLNDSPLIVEGFRQGANWAQEEFKKFLWYDAIEEPEENKFIVEKSLMAMRLIVQFIAEEHGRDGKCIIHQ